MAEQASKLRVSELDYASIKSNLIAFLKSQSEFANFDFADFAFAKFAFASLAFAKFDVVDFGVC